MKRKYELMVAAAIAVAVGSTSFAASLCVDANNANCYSTIQAAVDDAQPGDLIKIETGSYAETVIVPLGLDGITLKGAQQPLGPRSSGKPRSECATIDAVGNADPATSALEVRAANVTVENLCVVGGAGDGIHFGCDDGTGGCSPAGNNAAGAVVRNVFVNGSGDDCVDIEDDNGTITEFTILNCRDKCISWNGANAVIDEGFVRGCQDHGINLNVADNARVTNVEVSNMAFFTNEQFDCIRARGNNLYLADNTLRGCSRDGIRRESGAGGVIERNTIIGTQDDGMEINSDGVLVDGNTISAAQDMGIVVTANFVTLEGNRIRSADDDGISLVGDDAVVNRNRVDSSASFGILVDSMRVRVTNNWVGHATDDGIEVLDAADNVIADNTVEAAGGQGIDVSGDRMVVTGNSVEMSDLDGIELDCFDCTGVRVVGNSVTGTLQGGAECFDIDSNTSAGVVFENNVARFCGEDGVQLQGTQIIARGNTVSDSGTRSFHPGVNVFANGGGGHVVEGNTSDRNFNDGFNVDGNDMVFRSNTASCNAASGFGVDTFGSAVPATNLVYDGNIAISNNFAGLETRVGTTATVSNNSTSGNSIGLCNLGAAVDGGGNNFQEGTSAVCPAE